VDKVQALLEVVSNIQTKPHHPTGKNENEDHGEGGEKDDGDGSRLHRPESVGAGASQVHGVLEAPEDHADVDALVKTPRCREDGIQGRQDAFHRRFDVRLHFLDELWAVVGKSSSNAARDKKANEENSNGSGRRVLATLLCLCPKIHHGAGFLSPVALRGAKEGAGVSVVVGAGGLVKRVDSVTARSDVFRERNVQRLSSVVKHHWPTLVTGVTTVLVVKVVFARGAPREARVPRTVLKLAEGLVVVEVEGDVRASRVFLALCKTRRGTGLVHVRFPLLSGKLGAVISFVSFVHQLA